MDSFVTCAVVETTETHAFELGLALELDVPTGVVVREDPHVAGVFYLESGTEAEDAQRALALVLQTTAVLAARLGVPTEVTEVSVLSLEGATCWLAGDAVPTSVLPPH
ncbi:hypothetical protein SAMN05660199_03363 [Klenkia soli]|uniref:Uncharacterized protein n=1 Tax=Klenkia soli TaxID=1052260 RepID=A0A1H0QUU4_9ACTN|nr:hypothetical protein [Klenkia soli]SDP21092.1 hypothetical protein SAMN05660199_03363 [Klenkia soli]